MTVYFGQGIEAIYGATQWVHEGVKSLPIAGTHVYSKATDFMGSKMRGFAEKYFPDFVWNFLVNHKQGLVVTGVVFTIGVGLCAIYDAYRSGDTPPDSPTLARAKKAFEEATEVPDSITLDGKDLLTPETTTITKS